MGDPVVAFDLRRGLLLIGDKEQLAKWFKLSPESSDEDKATASSGRQGPSSEGSTGVTGSSDHRTSVRDFARGFVDRKLYERVAILLHYAHRVEGRATLTSRDLSDWFGLCGFKVPVRMDKTLDNLMRQRHIVERTGPGLWALSAAGENVALGLLEPQPANGQ